MKAHDTAIIDPRAEIASNVEIGPWCIVEEDVVIGDHTTVQSHAVIKKGTRLGEHCTVGHGAVLGGEPQDVKFKGERSFAVIGDHNSIREYVTIHRGSGEGTETRVGSHNMLMCNAHIGHNCVLGDNSVMANCAALGGFVQVGSRTFMGGLSGVHQFVKIGDYVMVGGASALFEDVPHYMLLAGGYRPAVCSLNAIGLMRAGFPQDVRAELRKAFRIMYKRGLGKDAVIEAMEKELKPLPEIRRLVDFLRSSERGLVKGRERD